MPRPMNFDGVFIVSCLLCLATHFVNTARSHENHNGHEERYPASYNLSLEAVGKYSSFQHTHSTILDLDGVMVLSWTPDLEKQEVTFTISARTRGWVGLGISSNGAMHGADIVTAWVKGDRVYVQDRYGDGHKTPPVDDKGHWQALAAYENNTHTVVTVKRDINTCDLQDFPLTNDTTRFIFAWGPVDPEGEFPPYHGPRRGAKFALALLPFHKPTPNLKNYKTWRISLETPLPPDKKTFYWCHIEKIPQLAKKHHYIGFSMIYGNNSKTFLHHSVAFECRSNDPKRPASDIYEQNVGHAGYECYTPSMPDHFKTCETFFINWAIGGEGELLPQTVGVPIGEQYGGADYLLIQTHYDNPHLKRDITVAFSMDIYYTENLRPNEAGNFAVGHAINFGLTIPPKTPLWVTAGHCSEHCTRQAFPPTGINVFMVFLHAHYLARAIRVRHFRDGEELPLLAEDSHFAADFQQSRKLSEEVSLRPGDHITVECDYQSTDRDTATFSGWEAKDEMCQAFISYYPRVDLALCRSTPTVNTMRDALEMPYIPSDVDLSEYVFCMKLLNGQHYQPSVNAIDWNARDKRRTNQIMAQGEHFIKCLTHGRVAMNLDHNTTRYPGNASPFQQRPLHNQCLGMPDSDFYAEHSHHHEHDHHDEGNHGQHDHGQHDHGQHDHGQHDHGQHDHDQHDHDQHDHDQHDHGQHDHGQHDHGQHDHGQHDHPDHHDQRVQNGFQDHADDEESNERHSGDHEHSSHEHHHSGDSENDDHAHHPEHDHPDHNDDSEDEQDMLDYDYEEQDSSRSTELKVLSFCTILVPLTLMVFINS
ncbi:DBH-like monooxygenase protein-like [Hyalella azteca]|uniref:DBH-like monooxygenase protein-like n=1 Tax=Hyalella azteca TaxID=294128 RepID=A0A6A0GXD0_HYAAZ|nr:DBH-like monooxygenase protein-like [Hyalella azteca]